jgi:phosphate transport system substrate-binding protein
MNTHQGIRVTVQGGGSGMGVTAVGMDVADLGAASRGVKDTELAKYPYLQTHKIGGSAVVVIADPAGIYAGENVTILQLTQLYNDAAADATHIGSVAIASGTTVVQRAESSGTEDTFADYISLKDKLDEAVNDTNTVLAAETGNAGVLAKVKSTTNSIGFVDFGFAVENGLANVEILGVDDGALITTFVNAGNSTTTLKGEIEDELANEDGSYANGLTRPLNYITKGAPSAVEQDFIAFAINLDQQTYFEQCGYFPILDIA